VFGVCADPCDWPTFKAALTWGPVGRVSAPQTPADAQIVKATCFDYTGDGLGDNGLKGLAGQINGPMATLVEGVTTVILLELAGVTDFTTAAAFPLNGLVTVGPTDPSTPPTDFLVPESAYQTDICIPTIRFKDASITVGALAAGPWEFRLSLPISDGLVIDAPLLQARLKATLTDGAGTDGVAATEGVLGGVLTKQQIVTALAKLQASCDAAPAQAKPDFCNYLKVAISAMNLLFDLHQVGDGTYVAKTKDLPGDAASICLMFTLSKARVVGFEAAAVQ
jgi:hypothetical protein